MTAEKQAPAIVSAVGLSKEFRDFWARPKAKAVNDIDFQVHEGEVLGLLGPNGSGKSTTVKMLLGLLYPTAGTLSVFGRSPRDVETKKRVGYLPEESYLYKYLTALETLDFFGSLFNLSRKERMLRAEQLLEMVGLEHARRRCVGEFSKGMQRRIGLAQAMINDPALLVLDEPTSGLDPLGCKEVKDLILLLKKRGKTVIVTSHLLSDVEDVCDRVIILYGGRIRATGTLDELLTIATSSRIVAPLLSPALADKVSGLLKDALGESAFTVDHPRMSLERFFLDVIDRARAESAETAGVSGGGKIAEYLTEETAAGALLQELAEPPKPAAPQQSEVAAPTVATVASAAILREVSAPLPPPETAEQTNHLRQQKVARDLSEANARLEDLLSGSGKNKE